MSGGGSGVNARLERYASSRPDKPAASASGEGGLQAAFASSQALAQLNKVVEGRDFGANLARDIARADLRLKPSEYLMIWAGTTSGSRPRCWCSPWSCPGWATRSSSSWARSSGSCSPASGSAAGSRAPRRLQQAAAGHDHPDRERPARRLLVPAGHRAGGPRVAATGVHRVRACHPRGQPRAFVRRGPREHGPPREVGRPGADGHGHLHPAHRRRQPRRDPRLDRVHHPGTRPHQGRIRTLTAQQRLSGYVVGMLPIGLAGFLFIAAPDFMKPMFDNRAAVGGLPLGVIILMVAASRCSWASCSSGRSWISRSSRWITCCRSSWRRSPPARSC